MKVGINKTKGRTAAAIKASETVNKAGGVAYEVKDPVARMLHIVGQMFGEPTYYKDADSDTQERTSEAQAVIDTAQEIASGKQWADLLPIAAWARTELHMRTTPIVIFAVAAEFLPKNPLAKRDDGRAHLRVYAKSILQRADEPRLAFAAWTALYGQADVKGVRQAMVPNSLKRAISDRLATTPENLLAKYNYDGSPSLADTIRATDSTLVRHPKFMYFVNREKWLPKAKETPTLQARYELARCESLTDKARELISASHATWEDVISQFGSLKETWEAVIPQMGYMAVIRNLRNFIEAGVDLVAAGVLKKLTDPEQVQSSRQLPFRFLSAARAVGGAPEGRISGVRSVKANKVVDAIDEALTVMVKGLPTIPGKTAFFLDNSGSMSAPISKDSTVTMVDAGNLLGALFGLKSEDSIICAFTDKPYPVEMRKADSVLTNMERLNEAGGNGSSTNAWLCPPLLRTKGFKADRIVLISDGQCWDSTGYYGGGSASFRSAVEAYRKWAGKDTWVHSINLCGTVQSQMSEKDKNVNLLSGFSDKVLDMICVAEGIVDGKVDKARAVPPLDEIRRSVRPFERAVRM